MSKLKMNCGYCGRKCNLDKDFCIPQDSVYVCKSCYEWQNRVADLEAKLAEKEKEIENLNNRILISQLQAPKEQILNILSSQCIQYNPDQDKISVALEQLEKVKEYIKTNLMSFQKVPIIQEINNQIKQLKEMK